MQELFLSPLKDPKARRVCINPRCAKLLSALNKQELCFCCHDRQMLSRRFPFPDKRMPPMSYAAAATPFLVT